MNPPNTVPNQLLPVTSCGRVVIHFLESQQPLPTHHPFTTAVTTEANSPRTEEHVCYVCLQVAKKKQEQELSWVFFVAQLFIFYYKLSVKLPRRAQSSLPLKHKPQAQSIVGVPPKQDYDNSRVDEGKSSGGGGGGGEKDEDEGL